MRGTALAVCDRLVHPSVTGDMERAGQVRVLGVLLAGPFLIAASAWLLLPFGAGLALTLAFICCALGAGWMGVLVVVSTAETESVKRAALIAGTVEIAALIAAAGGLASPVGALAVALPIEAWLMCRTKPALFWGTAAGAAALGLQTVLPGTMFGPAAGSAWHWVLPLAYGATVLPRLAGLGGTAVSAAEENALFPELEQVIDAALVRMASDGEVVDAGGMTRQVLGLEPDLLIGDGLFDRVHIADRVAYLSALADLRDGAMARKLELRLRLPQEGAHPVGDRYGDFAIEMTRQAAFSSIVTGLIRDNGEMAGLRSALAAAREENEKLDIAKSRFLAAVSHELRTPLNSIIGFSDMLLNEMVGGFQDPRQKEYVGLVRDSGHHLLDVVNSILDVSKIEAGSYMTHPEAFAFREAVEMCQAMMSVQAEAKAIRLAVQLAPDIEDICADRRAVQQMLINLVSNAVKFTPKGGAVTIGAKRFGSRLQFWVSDTGIGIAEHDLERLGRPFTQVQNDYTRNFEGTGLGLSLVKGLVTLHEGTMTIDSAVGDGTTVTISLPIDGPGKTPGSQGGELVAMKAARTRETSDGTLRKAS